MCAVLIAAVYAPPPCSLFEMCLPVIIMALLVWARTEVDKEDIPATHYNETLIQVQRVNETMFGRPPTRPVEEAFTHFTASRGHKLALAPDTEQVRSFRDWFISSYPEMEDAVSIFSDEGALDDYMTSGKYPTAEKPRIEAAIVFLETGPEEWDFKIRLNATEADDRREDLFPQVCFLSANGAQTHLVFSLSMWMCFFALSLSNLSRTLTSLGFVSLSRLPPLVMICLCLFACQRGVSTFGGETDDQQLGVNTEDLYGYARLGFMGLQLEVNEYILGLGGAVSIEPVVVQPFPTPAHRQDDFADTFKTLLGLFFVLAYLWPVTRLTKTLVQEKELRLKAAMKMMGLKSAAHFTSWWITYAVFALGTSLLVTLATADSVFENSSKSLIFFFFFMFGLSVFSFCWMVSALFSRASVASSFASLLFLG